MFDHPGIYQQMYPDLQSANMPPAPPPSPTPQPPSSTPQPPSSTPPSITPNIASTCVPHEIVATSKAAARREDQQSPLKPTPRPPLELSSNWTQADHNLLFIMHYSVHNTWEAAVEQLGQIDMQTNVSRNLRTKELFKHVDALNEAYGFKQIPYDPEKLSRHDKMVLENMVLYVNMQQISETAKAQRARIDRALYSPTVLPSDLASCDESHRTRQRNLPSNLSPL